MEIEEETLKYVTKIARLSLSEEEVKKFKNQLNQVLEAFKKIDEVDTSNLEPSFHPIEIKNVLRDDEEKKWEWEPLANTKHKEEKYFKGPRIV
ncbi:MAG: Asp-tRNA(Asn)/Glu-tRNA(Gln) amidotransferase subunit GatC [Candidatus Aenigmatarchaeota archaeon]